MKICKTFGPKLKLGTGQIVGEIIVEAPRANGKGKTDYLVTILITSGHADEISISGVGSAAWGHPCWRYVRGYRRPDILRHVMQHAQPFIEECQRALPAQTRPLT